MSEKDDKYVYLCFWDGPEIIGQQSNRSMICGPAFLNLKDCYDHLKNKFENRNYHWYQTGQKFMEFDSLVSKFNANTEIKCVYLYDYHWYKYWISKFIIQ